IKKVQPRMFLFENGKGLMTGRRTADGEKGENWRDVLKAFQRNKGYTVPATLVQAKDSGVPQNRPRVLIAGIRNDLGWTPTSQSQDAVISGLLPEGKTAPPSLSDVFGD